MGKNLLNSGFEDFLNGSGVWIVVGVLAATFVVSMVFLVLNILKDKKAAKEAAEKEAGQKQEEPAQEEIKEIKAEDLEEKPKKKRKTKKESNEVKQEETKTVEEPEAEKKQENPVEEKVAEDEKAEKPKEKKKLKQPKEKPVAEEKQEEQAKEESEEEPEIKKDKKVTYGVTYDKENHQWVVKKSGSSRASKRCATKAEALEVAEKLSEASGANLRVHKKNGKFQKI